MTMKTSRWQNRRGFLFAGATVVAAVAAATALTAPALAAPSHPGVRAGTASGGPGYPPPKGIYAPFTNCPLTNPLMHEVMDTNGGGFAACVGGLATGGSIKIGNIVTAVVENVKVQFGFFIPPGDTNFYPAPVVPPNNGVQAILSTKPDPLPESLTTALGCATATDPGIQQICTVAQERGGKYNSVYALAQEAGADISNFGLLNWTQPIKFHLINPLLGSNCYIGSNEQPVVVNPSLSVGPGGGLTETQDPDPTLHPDTFTLDISGAIASDTTFSAPGVLGCGPGGLENIAVDNALDASSGLPAASGTNSLTLDGNFDVAATTASEDSTLTQPQDDASILLSAFIASHYAANDSHRISLAKFKSLLHDNG